MDRGRALFCAAALALLALLPLPARAEPELGPKRQFAVMLGPNVGGSFHQKSGTLLGGEVSFVFFDDGLWFGLYTDALHDVGLRRTRFSIGPELGLGPFGVDIGYVREVGEVQPLQGWRVRGILSAFFVSAYFGPGVLQADHQRFTYREAGLLFKMPLTLF